MRTVPLLIGLAALVGCTSHDRPASPAPSAAPTVLEANAVVVRVVDGDTIVATIAGQETTVRLIGIDTPETVKPNTPVQCWGPEASAFTKSLLAEGAAVRIERDAEARDAYDRLLGYVYRAGDGTFVNLAIVAGGYARVLTIAPNTAHKAELVRVATQAEAAGLGLWSAC